MGFFESDVFYPELYLRGASQLLLVGTHYPLVVVVTTSPPTSSGGIRDVASIPGLGRSPGGGHGNPLAYSCLENPHGQRSLAGYIVHRVAKSQAQLKQLGTHI